MRSKLFAALAVSVFALTGCISSGPTIKTKTATCSGNVYTYTPGVYVSSTTTWVTYQSNFGLSTTTTNAKGGSTQWGPERSTAAYLDNLEAYVIDAGGDAKAVFRTIANPCI